MRIGIFTDTYPPYINGVSTSIVMLQHALEKKGHQVFVVTVNSENMTYKYENEDKIIRIPGILTGIYDYRLTGIYPVKALKKIKNWNLDVIHSHTEFGIGTFARIIAKQYGIPLVHTYHTMYEDYAHYITKGYFDGASKKIVEYLTKFYCDKTATELIVPTKKAYDLFKEKYHVNRNVHIVPTGIEIDRFYKELYNDSILKPLRDKYNIKSTDFVILFVGRMGKEKSVEVLIETHKELIKKYKNIKLLLIGDGPDMKHFQEISHKLNIADSVIFTGKVPWEEIPKYYQMATVFATASRSETQGLTVIEAMAASVPVLAANDDAFKMVVIEELNGNLFKNKKEYYKQVEEFILDKEKLAMFSKQARISAEGHSAKYFAEKVLDVYKTAIGAPRKKDLVSRIKDVVKRGFYGK